MAVEVRTVKLGFEAAGWWVEHVRFPQEGFSPIGLVTLRRDSDSVDARLDVNKKVLIDPVERIDVPEVRTKIGQAVVDRLTEMK